VDVCEHIKLLGSLVANLQSLEFVLRAFIHKYHNHEEPSVDLSCLKKGDRVPINSLTNYDSLGQLVNKYNSIVEAQAPTCQLDSAVVPIRDMLAHGRIASTSPDRPMHLLKFGKYQGEEVPVEESVNIDAEWLRSKGILVFEQVDKVQQASRCLSLDIM